MLCENCLRPFNRRAIGTSHLLNSHVGINSISHSVTEFVGVCTLNTFSPAKLDSSQLIDVGQSVGCQQQFRFVLRHRVHHSGESLATTVSLWDESAAAAACCVCLRQCERYDTTGVLSVVFHKDLLLSCI